MSIGSLRKYSIFSWLPALVLAWPVLGNAQVPVDAQGNTIGIGAEEIPLLSATELSELVGPIALYPDDLLAIVLPASTYPLQLVQADRFLQDLKADPELKPDEDWDDSIVALTNYPEVIELLVDDLDKTWRLGEAVVAQQADVIGAVESFRDRAYAAGNLQSDSHQSVAQNDGVIEITPVEEDVIYVPYYEPERVVVYQSRPAYYYYPRPYPVYNYPYSSGYAFNNGFFWGVTTAFTVGWFTDSLHVYHHSYHGHPYYGHSYWNNHYYRRHDIYAHNRYYYNNHSRNHNGHGDYWRPHSRSTVNHNDQRVTRNRHYPGSGASGSVSSSGSRSSNSSHGQRARTSQPRVSQNVEIKLRDRGSLKPSQIDPNAKRKTSTTTVRSSSTRRSSGSSSGSKQDIQFRERSTSKPQQLAMNQTRSSQPRTSRPSRSSQPKVSQPRTSQPSRSSQPKASQPRTSQPSRSSQPKSSQSRSSQPRSSQPRSSQPRSSQRSGSSQPRKSNSGSSGSSGSNKSSNSSRGKSGSSSRDRH